MESLCLIIFCRGGIHIHTQVWLGGLSSICNVFWFEKFPYRFGIWCPLPFFDPLMLIFLDRCFLGPICHLGWCFAMVSEPSTKVFCCLILICLTVYSWLTSILSPSALLVHNCSFWRGPSTTSMAIVGMAGSWQSTLPITRLQGWLPCPQVRTGIGNNPLPLQGPIPPSSSSQVYWPNFLTHYWCPPWVINPICMELLPLHWHTARGFRIQSPGC